MRNSTHKSTRSLPLAWGNVRFALPGDTYLHPLDILENKDLNEEAKARRVLREGNLHLIIHSCIWILSFALTWRRIWSYWWQTEMPVSCCLCDQYAFCSCFLNSLHVCHLSPRHRKTCWFCCLATPCNRCLQESAIVSVPKHLTVQAEAVLEVLDSR